MNAETENRSSGIPSTATRVVILTAVYFVSGMLGKESSFISGEVALVWPHSGIALAAILLFGYRFWPGVALGALLFSLLEGTPLGFFTFGTAVGNTVGALVCAWLLRQIVGFRNSMDRVRDVVGFVLFACLLGTTVNAMFNVVSLCYAGEVEWDDLFSTILIWWVPNAMGVLVVTPFLLAWAAPMPRDWSWWRNAEAIACISCLVLAPWLVFFPWITTGDATGASGLQNYPLAYLPFPILVWAALSFGQRGATLASLAVSATAIYGLLEGRGPFVTNSETDSLMLIGSYIGILTVTNMLLAAVATERKTAEMALRKSQQMFNLISENVSDLIAVKDGATGRRLYNSPSYERILRVEGGIQGSNAFEQVHPEDRDRVQEAFQKTVKTGEEQRIEYRFLLADGTTRYIESVSNFVRDDHGSPGKVVSIARDITERRQFQSDLAKARDAALSSARTKAEFLANMSHEIRTPLNGIVGMTSLLARTDMDARQRDFVETIRTSSDALLTIINDILDFSKIEAGKLTLEMLDFDLREAVEGTMELVSPQAHLKGIDLTAFLAAGVPSALRGDPGRLRQILTNLVGNAVKFTQKGEVSVRVTTTAQTEEKVTLRFEVMDTGVGISEAAQARLFQAFSQADGSTTRRFGGTGLGLAISRQLSQIMGGEIGLRSTLGQGSTFWFCIPFEKQVSAGQSDPRPEHVRGKRVLIVDDNATNRHILEHLAEEWGVETGSADGGETAMALLREAAAAGMPFDAALIDMRMPGMDGDALAEQIRHDPLVREMPLVLLSAAAEQIRGLGLGAFNAGLMKPIRPRRLLQTLERLFGPSPDGVRCAPAATPRADAIEGAPGHAGVRVLVAEDNATNQKVAVIQLQELGYSADAVANGLEVVESVRRIPYDIILMDCQMPEMDGLEATRQIRAWEKSLADLGQLRRPLHIIAMTANAMAGDRENCLSAGMDDYLCKPVDEEDLVMALDQWRSKQKGAQPAAETGSGGSPESEKVSGPPLVDMNRLLRLTHGDATRRREMIEIYRSEARATLPSLQAAVREQSASEIQRYAHKLAGASGSIGVTGVAHLARRLEQDAREGKLETAPEQFASILKELEAVEACFSELEQPQ